MKTVTINNSAGLNGSFIPIVQVQPQKSVLSRIQFAVPASRKITYGLFKNIPGRLIKKIILLLHLIFIAPLILFAEIPNVIYHLNDKGELIGSYQIYSKNDILFCTGDDPAGKANNQAAELMLAGDFEGAKKILLAALKEDALFLPFRYNLGICCLYLYQLDEALLHFTKARQIVPEYSKTYLQIGYIYDRQNKESEALEYFRQALIRNPGELETYILIGNIYFNRNQIELARKYYEKTLSIDPVYPNGLLGLAKIYFLREEYDKAIVLFKSIDTTREYDKAMHYYYAESAFKKNDYAKAAEQYEKLLSYRNDRFFLVNSYLLIKHKLELSRRFIE